MTPRFSLLVLSLGLAAPAFASEAPDDALRFPAAMPHEDVPTATSVAAGQGVKSLVERLRIERESQMGKQRVSPLGSGASVGSGLSGSKYLGVSIASSIARERQAASKPSVLPGSWNWSGDHALGLTDSGGGSRAAQSWRMSLDVPVTHFWGKATLSAGFERSESGTASEAQSASAPLQQGANISLRQDIKKGALSGSAQVKVSGEDSRQQAISAAGQRALSARAEGSARLKLQLAPGLAFTGSHASQVEHDTTLQPGELGATSQAAGSADGGAPAKPGQPAWDIERQASRRTNSELGVEWKLSQSLSLSGAASAVRAGQAAGAPGLGQAEAASAPGSRLWVPQWLSDESRANLALQRRTGGGSWGLKWSRGWAQRDAASQVPPGADSGAASGAGSEAALQRAADARSDALSLQAERKIFGWLSMKGSWKLAGETNYMAARLSEQATREAEARISGGLGSLALRYSDWASQAGQPGAALDGNGRREYGVRYEAGKEAGLGLALEYSVREERASQPSSNWKLGVTYR